MILVPLPDAPTRQCMQCWEEWAEDLHLQWQMWSAYCQLELLVMGHTSNPKNWTIKPLFGSEALWSIKRHQRSSMQTMQTNVPCFSLTEAWGWQPLVQEVLKRVLRRKGFVGCRVRTGSQRGSQRVLRKGPHAFWRIQLLSKMLLEKTILGSFRSILAHSRNNSRISDSHSWNVRFKSQNGISRLERCESRCSESFSERLSEQFWELVEVHQGNLLFSDQFWERFFRNDDGSRSPKWYCVQK